MLGPGDAIDIWVVEAALGSGGMGSVYRCHNRAAPRILAAVKVLEGGLRRYPEAEARFVREAEILFQLEHPNIVKVRNVRTDTDPPYLEMEFVAGESLDERLRRGPVPYPEAIALLQQCADAVAYLHSKGIRHRDIKPANLLVMKDGRLKLVDFGLAVEADTTRITQQGMAFGTVSYAPPEWITPEALDPEKWDAYAVGVVFYEVLTGRLAFPVSGGGTARQQAMQVILAKQGHPPLDPGPAFHDDVRSLVRDLTRANPDERLADMREVLRRTQTLIPALRGAAGVTLLPSAEDRAALDTRTVAFSEEPAPVEPATAQVEVTVTAPPPPAAAPRATSLGLAVAAFGGIGALALAGALVGFGVALAVGWWWANPDPRPVALALTGVPEEMRVAVEIAGEPTRIEDGRAIADAVAPGEQPVRWALGEDCTLDRCPGLGCPGWCAIGGTTVAVPAGDGPYEATLAVEPPAPRPVALPLPALPPDLPVVATLGGAVGRRTAEGLAFDGIRPGEHPLEVALGACPPEAAGCWPDGSCPPGCTAARVAVAVPVSGEATPARPLDVPAPAVAAPEPAPAAPAPAPAPAPPKPSGGRGRLVTVGELADWLASHPEYAPGGEFATKGGSAYLKGWTAAGPPAGVSRARPVTGVSAALAVEFCRGRGGVPSPDVEPRVPDQTAFEIRLVGSDAKLIERDEHGAQRLVPLAPAQATTGAGFRCVR